ncbi:hypothetical protein SAMN04487967_3538 [Natronorubrum sediminis]|uniref:Uncharacterized protein n=1 Tax=Natronorubrum sediminis TaxID=640943 RepID=A0A1H6G6R3_9EURY|nr:hypothetical protein SAMN04487967_3538 [Natronorubrum sediminis]
MTCVMKQHQLATVHFITYDFLPFTNSFTSGFSELENPLGNWDEPGRDILAQEDSYSAAERVALACTI